MATVTNKRKVLSIKEKVKNDTTNRKWKNESWHVLGICSHKFYIPKIFGKTEPKLLVHLNTKDGE